MSKGRTTISIEHELIKKAKERNINISGLTEAAVKKKIGDLPDSDVRICDRCGIEDKETDREFFWLWPDEKWICEKCDRDTIEKLKLTLATRGG